MWYKSFWFALGTCLVIGEALSLSGESALAQNITLDNSLGAQTSVVTPNLNINGINSEVISGGATRGVNLFHSFREFNVDSGRGAYFTNPAGIENILTRVTGTNRKGGRITITSAGVYGLQKRPELTDLSDINASSQAGPQLNGTVEINNPSIDPSQGLVNLPVDIVEPEVSQVCQAGANRDENRFVITGRGGLAASPIEPLVSDAAIANWIAIDAENETRSIQSVSSNPNKPIPQPIVEANGWVINAKGEVFLTADASTVTPHSSWRPATNSGSL